MLLLLLNTRPMDILLPHLLLLMQQKLPHQQTFKAYRNSGKGASNYTATLGVRVQQLWLLQH